MLLPETVDTEDRLPPERFVFAGQTSSLQWIVRGAGRKNLQKPVCEVFRVTSSTAVPMGELPIPYDAPATSNDAVVELVASFEAPASDRPARYLLKVWNETGKERTLLSMLFIRALPATTLDFLKGNIIHAVAFGQEDRNGWGTFLEKRGADIRWSSALPDSPGKSDLIFIRRGEEAGTTREHGNDSAGTVIHFTEIISPGDADRISQNSQGGRVCQTSLHLLRSLETSASSQTRLATLLNSTLFTP